MRWARSCLGFPFPPWRVSRSDFYVDMIVVGSSPVAERPGGAHASFPARSRDRSLFSHRPAPRDFPRPTPARASHRPRERYCLLFSSSRREKLKNYGPAIFVIFFEINTHEKSPTFLIIIIRYHPRANCAMVSYLKRLVTFARQVFIHRWSIFYYYCLWQGWK